MKSKALVQAAAVVLSAALFTPVGVLAQTGESEPTTMTDTAPLPASDRNSLGAVILMDEPVLAQREQMEQLAARAPDTRSLGAGPNRMMQRALTREDIEFQRALDEALRREGTPK